MTNQTTNSTPPSLRALIADDAYCMTFQSLPQYRAALLQSLAALANQPAPTAPAGDAGDSLRADANRYQMLKKHAFNRTAQGFDGPILQWTLTVPACEDDCADFDAAMDQYGSLADYVPHYPALAHQPAQEQAEPVAWRRATKHGWEYRTNAPTASTPGTGWLPLVDPAAQQEPVAAPTDDLTDDDRQMVARGMERLRKGVAGECRLPPADWHCTRTPGHEGPCAAEPETALQQAAAPKGDA